MRHAIAMALACVALAGCRTLSPQPVAAPDQAAAQAAQQKRATALGLGTGDCALPAWVMAGRVALSNGKQGGSGQLEWTQGAGELHMLLSAPITRQNWTLDVDSSGSATLQGVPNGPLRSDDAARLLRTATGWDIPVGALGCWVRGVAAAETLGVARIDFGADLLPLRIEQGGWTVDYSGWKPDPFSRLPMPSRINAQRGEDRVRLVVDRWGLE